jgi:hypothetical protein
MVDQMSSSGPDEKLHYIEEFRAACEQLIDDKARARHSVFDKTAIDLYWQIYNFRGAHALEVVEGCCLKDLKSNRGKIARLANAAYRSERDILLRAALKFDQGHHPSMKCKDVNFANDYVAWKIFTDIMDCRRKDRVIQVPDRVLEAMNREKRREALLGDCQEIKQRLNTAAAKVNVGGGGVFTCIKGIAAAFGFKPAVDYRNRTINGTYYQKQFESVMLNIQQFNDTWVDKWSLHDLRVCPTAWVNVNEWENHQAHGALTLGYTPPNEWSDVTKNHPAL